MACLLEAGIGNVYKMRRGHDCVKILVTGATGFLGTHVCRKLAERGLTFHATSLSKGVDLRDEQHVERLFSTVKPTVVINCASYVGGIQFGYKHPAELFDNNMRMIANLFAACHRHGVKRVINPISNCAYPADATLFQEKGFWDGPLHDSVLVYGMVRKMSWVGSWAYKRQYGLDTINLILSNMYGPGDHFEEERSHALGALVMKFAKAKRDHQPKVVVWGSGKPVREWLHVDDGAEALIRAIDAAPCEDIVNVGVAQGISILDLAHAIRSEVGYEGEIELDPSKPDGAPHKTVDGSAGERLLGWAPQKGLPDGIRETVAWYLQHRGDA